MTDNYFLLRTYNPNNHHLQLLQIKETFMIILIICVRIVLPQTDNDAIRIKNVTVIILPLLCYHLGPSTSKYNKSQSELVLVYIYCTINSHHPDSEDE